MRPALGVLAIAACSGPGGRVAPLGERVGAIPEPPPAVAPLGEIRSAIGELDADGRRDGDWALDCDGVALGCKAWYEHGHQVQWARTIGIQRYVIDELDGGWRWQLWEGDRLSQQGGLAFAPTEWTPDAPAKFEDQLGPPQGRACAGPWWVRRADGTIEY